MSRSNIHCDYNLAYTCIAREADLVVVHRFKRAAEIEIPSASGNATSPVRQLAPVGRFLAEIRILITDLPTSEIPKRLENEQEKTLRFESQTMKFTQELQNEEKIN